MMCGLLLLAAAVMVGRQSQPVTEAGAAQVDELLAADPGGGSAGDQGSADATGVPVMPGTPPAAPRRSTPATVVAESIGLRVPVDPVGVEPSSGQVAVPPPERAGWYRFGPALDTAAGSIVIAAHVDSAAGPGAFFRVAELAPDDRVVVVDEAGREHPFVVVGRTVYDKRDLPMAGHFARGGPPRLTLITCGGRFHRESREYRDNVVVTAVPA